MYIIRSGDVLTKVFWTFYVRSIYVLCSGRSLHSILWATAGLRNIFQTLQTGMKKNATLLFYTEIPWGSRNWWVKPFHATGLFLFPLKISENLWFSVFRGYRKRPVTWNGLVDETIHFLPTSNTTVGFSTNSKTILYQVKLQTKLTLFLKIQNVMKVIKK